MTGEPAAPGYRRAFWAALWVVALFVGLIAFPADDGLRHVGLAFYPGFAGWGAVYPFSVYEAHADYNPWLGHDLLLRALAAGFRLLPVSQLAQQYLLAQLLCIAFVLALLLLVVRRSGVAEAIGDGKSLLLAMLLTALLLCFPLLRLTTIRPFAHGTLFLVYCIGRQRFGEGLVSAALLAFLYPYLCWIYTLPAALAHLVRGSKRFALGALVATAVALVLQPASFWSLVVQLASSAQSRSLVGLQIGEFVSALQNPVLYGFFVGLWLLLVPQLPAAARQLRTVHLLALLFLPVALLHVRYLLDVVLCLLLVAYGKDAVIALRGPFAGLLGFWKEVLARRVASRTGERSSAPPRPGSEHAPAQRSSRVIRAMLAIGYLACLLLVCWLPYERYLGLRAFQQTLRSVPSGSLVLAPFNLQYRILFVRPDLRLVPSSELGFWSPGIEREYLAYFRRGEVCPLAHKVDARYFIEDRQMYIRPDQAYCLAAVQTAETPLVWRVVAPRPLLRR